jgi:trehalose/maltose hydrolase-like predicted phosphorylase
MKVLFHNAFIRYKALLLDKMDMAYTFYLRTSRLDLDETTKWVEGCHNFYGRNMDEHCRGFGGMQNQKQSIALFANSKNGAHTRLK